MDFQQVIMRLEQFWSEQGCLIWQPYNVQVGAGTMNPATVLRVLGPEPWNVAYVEPSIRPDDGRYGENPNRMQQFYQYQVILKPDPGNPQELYLDSLRGAGHRSRASTISALWRTTGSRRPWARGGWAGRSGWTARRSRSSPTSSRRAAWTSIRSRWRSPTGWNASSWFCRVCTGFADIKWHRRCDLRRHAPARRDRALHLQL